MNTLQKIRRSLSVYKRQTLSVFKRKKGRVLVTGTGRAGTTFLMRVFTKLGLNTGFSTKDFENVETNVGKAGLEKSILKEKMHLRPEIIKTPHAVDILDNALTEGWLKLDVCILPVRELNAAAASRASVTLRAKEARLPEGRVPGGLWKTKDQEKQAAVLAGKRDGATLCGEA